MLPNHIVEVMSAILRIYPSTVRLLPHSDQIKNLRVASNTKFFFPKHYFSTILKLLKIYKHDIRLTDFKFNVVLDFVFNNLVLTTYDKKFNKKPIKFKTFKI